LYLKANLVKLECEPPNINLMVKIVWMCGLLLQIMESLVNWN